MTGRGRLLVVALAVFALAVGVLLGSGPLRAAVTPGHDTDADALAQAQAAAEAARADAQLGQAFADAMGPAAITGRLDNRFVGLVRTADATDDDVAAASARLADAGASQCAVVALTDDWASDDRAPFRDALAGQIADTLEQPPTGATTSQLLSGALAQALVPATDYIDAGRETSSQTLWTILADGGLVEGTRDRPCDVLVLVSAGADVTDLGTAFAEGSNGAVVAFAGADAGGTGRAASVTNASTFYGAWAVVGTLIGAIDGHVGTNDASDAPQLIGGLGG